MAETIRVGSVQHLAVVGIDDDVGIRRRITGGGWPGGQREGGESCDKSNNAPTKPARGFGPRYSHCFPVLFPLAPCGAVPVLSIPHRNVPITRGLAPQHERTSPHGWRPPSSGTTLSS